MKVIHIHHPYQKEQIPTDDVVLVLGFFDGVHRGHQAVICRGKEEAEKRGVKLAVMTFNQHPFIVFKKNAVNEIKYLTTLEHKKRLMAKLGVDQLYVVSFTSLFAALKPQEFVDQYIIGLHAKAIVAGFDYTYGPPDIADMKHLPNYVQDRCKIIEVGQKNEGDNKISSTNIRYLLTHGKVDQANHLLGYTYTTTGVVIHGDARGRLLGFPTANLQGDPTVMLPNKGVYVVSFWVAGKWYKGMAQIGRNITFEADRHVTTEINLLDFDHDIYGEEVKVQWHAFIRDEIKFSGVEGLIEQLKQDEAYVRRYFAERKQEVVI